MRIFKYCLLLTVIVGFGAALPVNLQAQEEEETVLENAAGNQTCLNCHGRSNYFYYNENLGRELKERMNPYYIIDSAEYYRSNHKTFYCTDCHSVYYETFPHPGELRMEEKFACIDCHGGDEEYAKFNFEKIEEEYQKSVHSTKHSEDFTCWMCHNPHSYRITARSSENIKETIIYDNVICLSCHANIDKYQLLTDRINPNLLEKHEWLPNQALHFASVRCVECHAATENEILVAHNVQGKEMAVKKCVECHSANSILMGSLYKFQAKERRNKFGFFNASVLNDTYIIGANRNYYLNVVSLVFFGFVVFAVIIHGVLRFARR
ncbi:MAG: cytochrome c3 family protein [Bacteroidales bacterium]|nr:cytochrome c3 family protein [Bacteroidales bacterium]